MTSFLYDGDEVLLEQQGGATTAAYAYGNALVRKDGETPLFDGQGSERTVTNTGGAVQATLTLTAFGQALASTGSSGDPYQYAATSRYRNDGDAGLALVGARYYDAQVGAFITRDTYLDQKPYAYCDGDPVNAVDPSGHLPGWFKDILSGAATIGGGVLTAWGGNKASKSTVVTKRILGVPVASETTVVTEAVQVSKFAKGGGAVLIVAGTVITADGAYNGTETWLNQPSGQRSTSRLGGWLYNNGLY